MYQGINQRGRVVITADQAQMEEMRSNLAYSFLRWRKVVGKVTPPADVEDADKTTTDADGDSNTKGRRGRKTNREES